MKEKSKRHSAGTQRLKEVVLVLLFAGRERRGKKNLIDLSDLRVCGSIAFPSRNLECYKNLIIEKKIKVMSCFMAFSLSGSVSRELPTKAASMMLAGNVRYLY